MPRRLGGRGAHLVRQKRSAGSDTNEPGYKIHLRAAAFLRMGVVGGEIARRSNRVLFNR